MSLQFVARVPFLALSQFLKIVAASFFHLTYSPFPGITCLLIVVGNITVVGWIEGELSMG